MAKFYNFGLFPVTRKMNVKGYFIKEKIDRDCDVKTKNYKDFTTRRNLIRTICFLIFHYGCGPERLPSLNPRMVVGEELATPWAANTI